MKLLVIYQVSLLISACCLLAYWFAPWLYNHLGQDEQVLLSFTGVNAIFDYPQWLYQAVLALSLLGYAGAFLFRKVFFWFLPGVIVFQLLLAPFGGLLVITGLEVLIIDLSTLLAGFAIALALFTPLKDRFN